MLMKIKRPAILMLLALAPIGASHAADMAMDCRLKGGSVVPLPAAACAMEGGTPVSAAAASTPPAATSATAPASAPVAAPAPAKETAAAIQPTGNLNLDEAQKLVVDILGKTVGLPGTVSKNPESIDRTAKFDGCRLVVEEKLHLDVGNLISSLKDFKIDSAIDFRNVGRASFGEMGKVSSKAGDLGGEAIYFEEPRNKAGNNISISVFIRIKGDYSKYSTDRSFAALDGPRDDFWIIDEYGYPRDTIMGTPATDKIRILYILTSSDDAARLVNALDKVGAMCRAQPGEPGRQKN